MSSDRGRFEKSGEGRKSRIRSSSRKQKRRLKEKGTQWQKAYWTETIKGE
jgi:hypothetical protein